MVGLVARHPALTTLVVGGAALGIANAVAPDNAAVRFATDGMFIGGVLGLILGGTGTITRHSGATLAVGSAMIGASLIGQVIRRAGD